MKDIETEAQKGWVKLHGAGVNTDSNKDRENWQYYLKGVEVGHSLVQQGYPESALQECWQQGYSNGLLYDMSEDLIGPKPTYQEWLKEYNETHQKTGK